jgi:hypothetical protein
MYIGLWLLSVGHVSILLHLHCTPGPSPCIYKRKGQGPHTEGEEEGVAREDGLTNRLALSVLSPSRTLVTPTASASLLWRRTTRATVFPLVFRLAPTHLGWGTQRQFYSSVQGPPGVETPTVGVPGRGLLRVDEQLLVEFQMGSIQQPLQPGTLLRFGSLEFMSLDSSYDMVLLPPQRDSDNDGRQLAWRRRTQQHLPPVAKEQHSGSSRRLPRRRRRRRGNRGQAGGDISSAVERVDGAGTPAGDMSGIALAPEMTTSVVSPQHANPKRIDDASTLVKDLLGVSLVPEIMVQSVPDATSSPSIDREVPSVFHSVPFRFSFDPPSDPASVSAFTKAYPNLPGYHMWSTWDRLTTVSTYRPPGSEEGDEPNSSWDFFGLGNPSAMRDFMTACDYCLSDCSDDGHSLDDEGCGPSRKCFHVDLGGHDEGNHLGMPEDDDPPGPAPRVVGASCGPRPCGGQDTQLEQIREMQAKLDEEAGQLVQLRQNIEQEWAGRALAGEARHQAQDVQRRITDDARARLPPASSGVGQNLAAAAILLRAMPEPSTIEGRRIHRKLKNLLEDATVRRAESSASRRQGYPSEHRTRLLDSCGKPRSTPGARGTRHLQPRVASTMSTAATTVEPASTKRCAEATTPGMGDATTVGRTRAPRPNHLVRKPSAGPYDGRRSRPGSEPRLPSPSTRGKQGRNCGLRTTGWPAS